jgi:ATP-dependent DNA helicase RecG
MVTGFADKDLNKALNKDLNKDLSANQTLILNEILKNNKITQQELSDKVKINERNIRNSIKKLKELGILKRLGSSRSGHWVITAYDSFKT